MSHFGGGELFNSVDDEEVFSEIVERKTSRFLSFSNADTMKSSGN